MSDELSDMEAGARQYFDDFEGGRAPTQSEIDRTASKDDVEYINKMMKPGGGVDTTATQPVPLRSAQPKYRENGQLVGGDIGKDGKSRTQFGAYMRVVDQNTGATSWEKDGKPVTAPQSVQMMEAISTGRRPGANSWSEAVKLQQAENTERAIDYTRRAIEFNRQSADERRRKRAQFDAAVGDQLATALDALNGKDAVIKEGRDGRRWKMGYVNAGALKKAGEMIAERGGRDALGSVIAYQQVDKFGNPVGDAQFALTYVKDGNVQTGGRKFFKRFSMADAAKIMSDAQIALGNDEMSARNYAVNALRGANPFNWDVGVPAVSPSVEAARVRAQAALDLEKMKQAGKIDLAKLTSDQRRELQQAELTLKKYGIDAGIRSEREKDETERKRIAADLMKKLPEVIAGMGLKDEQADEFRTKLMKAFEGGGQTAAKTPQNGGGEDEPAPAPTTSDIRTDKQGVKWMVVRDENGKPIGKKRVQ